MSTSFVLHSSNCRNVSNDYTKLLFAIDVNTAENLRERGCNVKSQTSVERGVVYSVAIKIPSNSQCDHAGTLQKTMIQLGKLYDIVILGKPFEFEGKSGITLEGYVRLAADPIEKVDPRVEELLSSHFSPPTHNPRLGLNTNHGKPYGVKRGAQTMSNLEEPPARRRFTSAASIVPQPRSSSPSEME